ncbi:11431_t:CDS:2, partial [Acaulospora morrowiae]
MNFDRYIENYIRDSDPTDWNALNCLKCLKDNDDLDFTSDSKQDILDAFIKTFKKVIDSPIVHNGAKRKAKKIFNNIKDTFERREIDEFFEELDHEFDIRKTDREVHKNVDTAKTLGIQEQRSNKKRKTEGNTDVKRDSPYDGVSGDEERKPTKPQKKKTSGKREDILPDSTKLEKATPLKLITSDDDDSSHDSSKIHESDNEDGYNSDEEDVPLPEESLDFVLNNQRSWILPSGQSAGGIFTENISANAVEIKKKKRLSAVEKAILRYGASRIIDLSAHMKEWFSLEDRRFMMNDYMSLLHVPGLKDEESSFVTTIENMVNEKRINEAYEFCVQKFTSSDVNCYVRKISKIYLDFIYRSEDGDILDSAHTEVDVILKACSYIVEGLRKSLVVKQRWGESFCPLSKNADYKNGRKCDVRFLSPSGVDLGEWEFASNLTSHKAIGDRCRSARINQSILNGLLNRNLTNVEVKKINVPFLQIAENIINEDNKSLPVKEISISIGKISKDKLETVNEDNNIKEKVESLLMKEVCEPDDSLDSNLELSDDNEFCGFSDNSNTLFVKSNFRYTSQTQSILDLHISDLLSWT